MNRLKLENWLADLRRIIFDVSIALDTYNLIMTSDYGKEEHILNNGFLQNHTYQLRFITVIQLSKVFTDSRSQKRNLHKLCNQLLDNDWEKDIYNLLDENSVLDSDVITTREELITSVNTTLDVLAENQEVIGVLTTARNKLFAHHDPEANVAIPTTAELESLYKLSVQIYKSMHDRLFNISTDFSPVAFTINDTLRSLSEHLQCQLGRMNE